MKSVVICGSKRFKSEARAFARKLKDKGIIVYEPFFHIGKEEWSSLSSQYKEFIALGLAHEHFYKIQMADVVFVYNKDGYVGNSVTLELGYAVALGKPIYALHKDEELCRQVLFRGIVKNTNDLVKMLK